ncbi:hypothetical protein [Methanococcoides methylutens]|uniref:hypothetical protein n=1 Tax=Methanococcoides methylutens TaxID=2226 RepID=UPI0012E04BC5|nr:hypothetical protein [Methanococcoides methylutens]
MNNNSIFDKDFADDFLNKYGDVVEHWKDHTDPIKRGVAIMLENATKKEEVKV